jgi:hypothetical protein
VGQREYLPVPCAVVAKQTLFPMIGPADAMSKKPVESTTPTPAVRAAGTTSADGSCNYDSRT